MKDFRRTAREQIEGLLLIVLLLLTIMYFKAGAEASERMYGVVDRSSPPSDAYLLLLHASLKTGEPVAEIECLAKAVYFEARGESFAGRMAVAAVVINRKALPHYPGTLCGVVTEQRRPGLHFCQFSFFCDGKPDRPLDESAWIDAIAISVGALEGCVTTGTATHYHADYVNPDWTSWSYLRVTNARERSCGEPRSSTSASRLPCASNGSSGARMSRPVSELRRSRTRSANSASTTRWCSSTPAKTS